jgi:hypothetical protein
MSYRVLTDPKLFLRVLGMRPFWHISSATAPAHLLLCILKVRCFNHIMKLQERSTTLSNEHGQEKREGNQEGKSDMRVADSKSTAKGGTTLCTNLHMNLRKLLGNCGN